MINRYYPRPAILTGIGDFLVNFAAARKAKQEAESQLEAQASQQQSSALANFAGSVGGAAAGGLLANRFGGDLNAMQRMQLATSFVPGLEGASRAAGGIGRDQAIGERQQALQDRAIQGDAYLAGIRAYIDQHGQLPPGLDQLGSFDAVGAPGGPAGPPSDAGGVPSPVYNPSSMPAYQKAQRMVQAYDAHMMRPMSQDERAAIQQQLGPEIAKARQVLARSQPPPPPRTYEEMLQAGAHNGGVTRTDDGRLIYPARGGGMSISNPPRTDGEADTYTTARDAFIQQAQQSGTPALEAMKQWNREWAAAHVVEGERGTTVINPKTGEVKYDERNRGGSLRDSFDPQKYMEQRMTPKGDVEGPSAKTVLGEIDSIYKGLSDLEVKNKYRQAESLAQLVGFASEQDPQFGAAMQAIEEAKAMSITGPLDHETSRGVRNAAIYAANKLSEIENAVLRGSVRKDLERVKADIRSVILNTSGGAGVSW